MITIEHSRHGTVDEMFDVGRPLGEGLTATAYEARCRRTGRRVVLKVVQGDGSAPHRRWAAYAEAAILAALRHDRIVRISTMVCSKGAPLFPRSEV